ncbi:MAG: peptidase M14 [Ignavibacteriales bacterium]|nr:peptidase M14 [Ignavibacteriales bacterium]
MTKDHTSQSTIAQELFDSYPQHKLSEIQSRRFTQADMFRWIKPLHEKRAFEMTPLGQSAEGRPLSLLKLGNGATKVLMWSQMHGDEPTATMALLDMLNFFANAPAHSVTKTIRENLTLLIIPMLNPDGAERFQRRTAQRVDMNRDAIALETPEARILKETRNKFNPQFGFNLHDQDPRYTVGATKEVSTIALLAPAFNEERSDNNARLPAKKVAAMFASVMNQFIPGHVSKYDDTFEPRAFGDNIQRWGTSTVLVESGGRGNDRDKMFIRKLNYVGLLMSLCAIATREYEAVDVNAYEQLPFNTKNLYDLILRDARIKASEHALSVKADIGINIDEQADAANGNVTLVGKVMDIGDLSTYGAFEEINLAGVSVNENLVRIDAILSLQDIHALSKKK